MLGVSPLTSKGLLKAQADVTLRSGGNIPHLKAQASTS